MKKWIDSCQAKTLTFNQYEEKSRRDMAAIGSSVGCEVNASHNTDFVETNDPL